MRIDHHAQSQGGRFEGHAEGGSCELDYLLAAGVVTFTHTGVPTALQGRGLAAELVVAGLQWAQAQGHKVVPACSYVEAYIRRHPQWQSMLA